MEIIAEKKQRDKSTIVLIEDEPTVSTMIENKLTAFGYIVKSAADGITGLALIESAQPDLVLLDMVLPGMDGFEVLQNLHDKKIIPSLPVVIISNSGQLVETERAIALGARDYLIKINFDPDEILAKVKLVLSSKKTSGNKKGSDKKTASNKTKQSSVLIIEDELLLNELMGIKLSQQNYTAYSAADSEQAQKILDEKSVDIILLDLVLPGVDGFTYLTQLKNDPKTKNIPVIILSNLGQTEEIEKGLKAGAEYYMIKANTTTDEITLKIGEVIEKYKK